MGHQGHVFEAFFRIASEHGFATLVRAQGDVAALDAEPLTARRRVISARCRVTAKTRNAAVTLTPLSPYVKTAGHKDKDFRTTCSEAIACLQA